MFERRVTTEAELRSMYRDVSEGVASKVHDRLDGRAAQFIATAPFVLLGTASPDGTGDVSPKGGPSGFVRTFGEQHLAVPDLSGNNLLDTITNVVNGSGIGLLFIVPGRDETLRVNGHACVTTDDEILDACTVEGRRPKVAIGVTVTQQYMHCAKAFRRSKLWDPPSWPDASALPTLGCLVRERLPETVEITGEQIDELLESEYAASMWEPGGK